MKVEDKPEQDAPATPDWSTLTITQGDNLPHWTCESAIYHVSFRLSDSVPSEVRAAWIRERESIIATAEQVGRPLSEDEEKRLQYLYSEKIESFLDAGHGVCHMNNSAIADLVADALRYFDGERYRLHAWSVMPNHVHAIAEPFQGHPLGKIVHSWKSFTANTANRALHLTGSFWQHEPYDHIVRSEKEYRFQVDYVWGNPDKAGLANWQWRWRKDVAGASSSGKVAGASCSGKVAGASCSGKVAGASCSGKVAGASCSGIGRNKKEPEQDAPATPKEEHTNDKR